MDWRVYQYLGESGSREQASNPRLAWLGHCVLWCGGVMPVLLLALFSEGTAFPLLRNTWSYWWMFGVHGAPTTPLVLRFSARVAAAHGPRLLLRPRHSDHGLHACAGLPVIHERGTTKANTLENQHKNKRDQPQSKVSSNDPFGHSSRETTLRTGVIIGFYLWTAFLCNHGNLEMDWPVSRWSSDGYLNYLAIDT